MASGDLVHATTRPVTVPYVPELRLRLTDEVFGLWETTDREAPPFWAVAWAGGQALARHVLDHPGLVAGRHVLDVAAGSGLVGLAAARAGAASVTFSDIDPYARTVIAMNAVLNDVSGYRVAGDVLAGPCDHDVVLAGDIFYDRTLTDRMLRFLDHVPAGTRVLVGDPYRAHCPPHGFREVAHHDVPATGGVEESDSTAVRVLEPGGVEGLQQVGDGLQLLVQQEDRAVLP